VERTLAIIKPDAVQGRHIGDIIAHLERYDLGIRQMERRSPSIAVWEEFYKEHLGKPFYERLIRFMSSGPSIFLVLEGGEAIKVWRTLMGSTDPTKADPCTIRGKFGTEGPANAVHGSDSPESAKREIALFFPEEY
jgi:nucleoside-diphosphate kinase